MPMHCKNPLDDVPFWSPPDGQTVIRIIPYEHEPFPFVETKLHYNLRETVVLSPIMFGKKDPFVEYGNMLGSKRGDLKTYPSHRIFCPIIVRTPEGDTDLTEGVRFWGFGKQVYETILTHMRDPDFGNITDPECGRDIVVTRTKPHGKGSYPKTDLRVKPNVTPASGDPDVTNSLLRGHPNLMELYRSCLDDDTEFLMSYARGLILRSSKQPTPRRSTPVRTPSRSLSQGGVFHSTPRPNSIAPWSP